MSAGGVSSPEDLKRWEQILARIEARAEDIEVEFNLSVEQYAELRRDWTCRYCGLAVFETAPGLDRVDSSKGYTIDNVVPCCVYCNRIKNCVYTYDEMRQIGKVIASIRDNWPNGSPIASRRPKRSRPRNWREIEERKDWALARQVIRDSSGREHVVVKRSRNVFNFHGDPYLFYL